MWCKTCVNMVAKHLPGISHHITSQHITSHHITSKHHGLHICYLFSHLPTSLLSSPAPIYPSPPPPRTAPARWRGAGRERKWVAGGGKRGVGGGKISKICVKCGNTVGGNYKRSTSTYIKLHQTSINHMSTNEPKT